MIADGIKISREQANKILEEAQGGPIKRAVICYSGQWYDVREMTDDQISAFISKLLGHKDWRVAEIKT